MRKIPYVYARSLEFEGRHPHDVGQWGVTNMRLLYLEGLPQFLEENMVPINDDGTFQSTPTHLHTYFWPQRVRYYRRIRSANEAASAMKLREPDALTKVCLPLYSSWVKPDKAIIEMPPPGEVPAPETHAVHLKEFFRLGGSVVDGEKDAPYFLFQNTWGDEWGLNGMALLPFAYYNKYAFEQWAIYNLDQLTRVQVRKLSSDMTAWQGREEFDRRVYAFEVGNPDRERLGWAFATESKHGIELEELFVAPGARGQGIGARLADMVRQLAQAKSMPLAMWVPFADTQRESPATFPAEAGKSTKNRVPSGSASTSSAIDSGVSRVTSRLQLRQIVRPTRAYRSLR